MIKHTGSVRLGSVRYMIKHTGSVRLALLWLHVYRRVSQA
eukprot:SAG31_NODE_27546_length_424_cov_0.864615_1_plen_39_part_10